MMKKLFKSLLFTLILCLFPLGLLAQEKTLAYYNSHESEILPDAQSAFRKGDYNRTLELCRWHYIIFGDDSAYALRDKANQCSKLAEEMNRLKDAGQVKEAKLKANAILSLNPDDEAARAILMIEDPKPVVEDTIAVEPLTAPVDSVTVGLPEEQNTEADEKTEPESYRPPVEEHTSVPIETAPEVMPVTPKPTYEPHTRFVIKAGAAILDMKQGSQTIAPAGAIGIYDAGGSRFGTEVGAYICPGLSAQSVSLIGLDASIVLRAATGIYPKLEAGFFSCRSTKQSNNSIQGLCAGAGITFLLGRNACVEIGAKYYPSVKLNGSETVTTTPGASYEFPIVINILSGGIAPFISVGWLF